MVIHINSTQASVWISVSASSTV